MAKRTSTTAKLTIATARTMLAYCLQTGNGVMLRIAGEDISLHYDNVAHEYVIDDTITGDVDNAIALLRSATVYKLTLVQTVSRLARHDWSRLEWMIPTVKRWTCDRLVMFELDDCHCEFTYKRSEWTLQYMRHTAGLD